jgi:hypothetical protein
MSIKDSANLVRNWNFRNGGLLDETGNSTTATVTNNIQWLNSRYGRCLKYDGDSGRLDVGTSGFGAGNISFIAIVNLESRGESNVGRLFFNGKLDVRTSTIGGFNVARDGSTFVDSGNVIDYGTDFYHLAFTSTSAGVTNLYINGILSGAADQDAGTPATATTNDFIGNNNTGSRTIDGRILEIQGYDTILTTEQIAQSVAEWRQEPHIGTLAKKNFIYPSPLRDQDDAFFNGVFDSNKLLSQLGTGNPTTTTSGIIPARGVFRNEFDILGEKEGSAEWDLNPTDLTDYTIWALVKLNSNPSSTSAVISTGVGRDGIFIDINGIPYARCFTTSENNVKGSASITGSGYSCLIATYNNTSTESKFYLDGVLQDTQTEYPINLDRDESFVGDNPRTGLSANGARIRVAACGIFNSILSDADRAELCEYAKNIPVYKNTFEDAPVSLGATSQELNGWRIETGTWKIGEDATGKHLLCVTDGQVTTPLEGASSFTTDTFQETGSATLTKNTNNLQIDAVAGDKIYSIILTV